METSFRNVIYWQYIGGLPAFITLAKQLKRFLKENWYLFLYSTKGELYITDYIVRKVTF